MCDVYDKVLLTDQRKIRNVDLIDEPGDDTGCSPLNVILTGARVSYIT